MNPDVFFEICSARSIPFVGASATDIEPILLWMRLSPFIDQVARGFRPVLSTNAVGVVQGKS
jgi:hypothetical protein